MKVINSLIFAAVVLLTSCSMDDDYTRIEPAFRPYLHQFMKEANARGIQIDTVNLKIVAYTGISDNAQGRTYYNTKTIQIDTESVGWKESPTTLLFHELGHLYLHREHDNRIVNRFYIVSIMASEFAPNFEPGYRYEYRRQYYIDQLFDPSIPLPEWND